jgi:hypothetical protein
MMLVDPLVSFDAITIAELNRCLVSWEHKMGPWNRPDYGSARFHGLRHNGELLAVVACDRLIAETTAGLGRDVALELGRVCAARRDLNRVALRLWREFVFPAICQQTGQTWAVSYQDAVLHGGDLYRFDGWARIGESSSGTDQRSGRKGRRKVIWGWQLPTAVARQVAA